MAVTRFPDTETSWPRRAREPDDQPDRDHHDGAEQEVAPQPAHRVEAHVPYRFDHPADALDDVAGIEAEGVQDDADQDAEQHQPHQDGERRSTEETADVGIRHEVPRAIPHSNTIYSGAEASIFSRVSSRSASRGGLSQRSRLMRGKRIATPDLWRVGHRV